ncbi:MFS transporter (macronuclear) [Tetrahymena thermophila SB210]|uniref:Hexose transporter 1 n=1 Tax=Tetrahymena thermophila (strain SB210) TaxID=312017 RepID=W7XGB3_TETTS|nr:MFS transporter [Tetrahymena thermophila SB210]EWS75983.1 MFS transporter [Tetrahymena thermophila SB210]|eukprot:XP_012651501.1 MFS transporter [Tetrahymena thermophila SB210]
MPGRNYQHKSSLSLFLRVQSVCTGAIYQGYTLTEMLFTGNYILSKYGFEIFNMSESDKPQTEQSRLMTILIGPILCIAGMLTTYFTPHYTTKLERRQCMMISDIVFLIATVFTQLPAWELFMVARLLMGVSCGIDLMITPLYIREVSPDNMAAKTGSLFQANIFVGVIAGFLMSIPVQDFVSNDQTIGNDWRWVFILPAVFSIQRLISLLIFYKEDTPYYYYRNRQHEKGRKALEQIYQQRFVKKFEQQLLGPGSVDVPEIKQRNQTEERVSASSEDNIVDDRLKMITNQQEHSYHNRLRVGLVVNLCQQMSGCTAMIGLSPNVIGLITDDYETKKCMILGTYLFLFFVATLGVGFNRKLARKKYLVGGFLLCAVFQIILAIISYFTNDLKTNTTLQFVFLMFVFFFYASYNFTVGPVTVILTSDILKDRGFSYSIMMNWVGVFLSIMLLINPQQYINHIIYGTFALFGFLFSVKYIVETKWLNFNDIQDLYQDIEHNLHESFYVKQNKQNENDLKQNLLEN